MNNNLPQNPKIYHLTITITRHVVSPSRDFALKASIAQTRQATNLGQIL
jgi:hypothetical protein